MPRYVAGSASLPIVPDLSGFETDLKAQLAGIDNRLLISVAADTASATGALDDVQTRLDRLGSERVAPTVGVTDDGSAGRFADTLRARLEAAVSNLPAVHIDGDSSDADRAIADVRSQLVELSNKTIGIDISDTDALVKLAELKAQLDQIGANAESVQVAVDTAAASAELARLEATLEKIANTPATARVDVTDDGAVGRFADAMRARIDAAVTNLPAIHIDADSTDADRKLAQVHAELLDLSSQTIGVDISAADALAKLADLKTRLDDLGRNSPNVQVRTDTAAASAELARFQAELDKINGETATAKVNVDDGGSLARAEGGFAGLMSVAAAVSPAIIPISAAAVAAGGALTGMSVVGVGALGTLVLGFHGVSDATKLLTTDQTATGDALAQTQAAIGRLDPATRNFAEYLQGPMHTALKDLQTTAAAGLLPGVEAGLTSAMSSLPQVRGLIDTLATSMGGLAREAGASLGGPFWQNFLTMIQGQAGPIVSDFGHILGNLATGFAGITEAFLPMARNLSDGLAGLSAKFADFGKNLASSSGFATFTAYVQTEWPVIQGIIENVATAVGHLIQAGAPLGGAMLSDLRVISAVLAALPVPVVEALAAAFAAVKIQSAIAGPIQLATTAVSGFAQKALDAAGGIESVGTKTSESAKGLSGWATASEDAATKGSKVAGAISSIGGALPIVGTALALGAAAWQSYSQDIQDNINMVANWKIAQSQGGQAANEATQKIAQYQKGIDDASKALDVASKSTGVANASTGEYGLGLAAMGTNLTNAKNALGDANQKMQDYLKTLDPVQRAQAELNIAIQNYGPNSDQAKAATDRLKTAQDQAKASADAQAQAVDGVNRALLVEQDRILGVEGASITYRQALDAVTTAHKASTDALAKYGPASDQYRQALLNEESAMTQAASGAGQLEAARHKDLDTQQQQALSNAAQLIALNDLKAKYGELPPELEKTRAALAQTVTQGDLTKVTMDNLSGSVKAIPDAKTIIMSSTGPEVDKQLQELGFTVQHMPDGTVKVTADTKTAEADLAYLARQREAVITTKVEDIGKTGRGTAGLATGGFVSGPGTGTSDSIPAMLSDGEFVVKAASVAQYGVDFLHSINSGAYALGGMVQRFAAGGPVSVPVPPPVQHFAAGGGVSANWGGTIDLAPGDISPLAQFWADALNNIATISGNARTYISGQFQGLSTDVTGVVQGIPAAVAGPWSQVTNAMTAGANSARAGVATAFSAVPAAVIGPVTQAQTGASQQFALLAANVGGSSAQAQSTASQQFAVLNTNAVGSATQTNTGVSGQWTAILAAVTSNATQAQGTGSAQSNSLRDNVISAMTLAQQGATQQWTTILAAVTSNSTQAQGTGTAQSNTLRDNVISAMTLAQSGTTQQWSTILASVTSNATQAQGTGTTQSNTLRDNVISAMTMAQTTATTQWATLRTNVSAESTTAQTVATQQTGLLRDNVTNALTTAQTTGTAQWATFRTNISNESTTAQTTATQQTGLLRDNVVNAMTTAQTGSSAQWVTLRTNIGATSTGTATDTTNTFNAMGTNVTGGTKTTVTNASNAWAGIRGGFAGPVDYVVNTVLNNGLFLAFNAVSKAVALPNVVNAVSFSTAGANAPIAAAEGGHIPGWSPHDKADNIPAMLTAGEFVQPVATVENYGVGFMEAVRSGSFPVEVARRYADGGRVSGSDNDPFPQPGAFVMGSDSARLHNDFLEALNAGQAEAIQATFAARYARGGQVKGTDMPPLDPGTFVVAPQVASYAAPFLEALDAGRSGAIAAAGGPFARGPGHYAAGGLVYAQQIAQAMNGQPYVWGGVGPNGADCSGYQSVITNALRGAANVYSRVGTTANFPWAGFQSGLGSSYSVGSTPDAGGGVGHMAGTLGGINVESGGAHGNVAYGGPAAGADASLFNIHAYLPEAGGVFASGGAGGGGATTVTPQLLGGQWADEASVLAYLKASFTAPNDALPTKFSPSRPQIDTMHGVAPTELDNGWTGSLKGLVDAWFAAHPPIVSTSGAGAANPGVGSTGPVQDQVKAVFKARGWDTGAEWAGVDYVVSHESGWNPAAQNPTSTASGLFQFIDGTWAAYRPPEAASFAHAKDAPVPDQAAAGMAYIAGRYGDPIGAQAYWAAHGNYAEGGLVTPPSLYDDGGWLPPGLTTVYNGTGRPEAVRTAEQERKLVSAVAQQQSHAAGSYPTPEVHVYMGDRELTDLVDLRVEYRNQMEGRMMRSGM